MPRIIICEDEPRFRHMLSKILGAERDFEVDACACGEDAVARCLGAVPDLLLLDLELPGIGGLEVVERLRGARCPTEILVLTSFNDETKVFEAIRGGAAGYLVKGIAPRRLVAAIRDVLRGGTVIEAKLARRFWNHFASVQGRQAETYGLSAEEVEVLSLVARGLSNPEAASALGASRRSIKRHLESIYRKLDVTGRVEATVKALQAGLIEI